MDKELGKTTNLCVEIMNSKRQVMGKLGHLSLESPLRQTARVKFKLKILKKEMIR